MVTQKTQKKTKNTGVGRRKETRIKGHFGLSWFQCSLDLTGE